MAVKYRVRGSATPSLAYLSSRIRAAYAVPSSVLRSPQASKPSQHAYQRGALNHADVFYPPSPARVQDLSTLPRQQSPLRSQRALQQLRQAELHLRLRSPTGCRETPRPRLRQHHFLQAATTLPLARQFTVLRCVCTTAAAAFSAPARWLLRS